MAFLPTPTPFTWGANGQQLTPDQVERLRVVSALAARNGADASPVGHWSQGLARLVDAWGGYKGNMRADAQEAAGLASADDAIKGSPVLASLLGGDQAGMATPSPVVSALAQQGQAAPTPSAPQFAADGSIQRPDVMSLAGKAMGLNEREQKAALQDFLATGGQNLDPEITAWCAAFVNATLKQAGMEGTGQLNARSYLDWGQPVDTPQRGDVAVFSRGDPNGWQGHVGFFEGYNDDGTIRVLGGNQGDAVSVANYSPDQLLGFRRGGMGGGSGGGGTGQPNNVVAALAQAQGNPWVAKKYGGVIEALMGQQMQRDNAMMQAQLSRENASFEQQLRQSDPMYQAQLQQAQLQLDQARNPVREPIEVGGVLLDPVTYQPIFDSRQPSGSEGFTLSPGQQRFDANGQPIASVPEAAPQQYRTISGTEASQLGLDPAQAYNIGPDGKITQIGGGGTNVTVNNAGADKFAEAFASGDAATLNTVSDAGMSAQRNLARVDRLESLLSQGPSGLEAGAKSLAGEYGIKTEGLDTLQAAQALINTMVPEQRQPGSGPMSDADLALYKQSLPRLINTAEGNALIVHTLRGIAQYDAEGAQIVQRLRAGQIDRATAFEMLQSRQNPLAGFGEQASRFQAPSSAQGLSGADWQDVNGMPGVKVRVK